MPAVDVVSPRLLRFPGPARPPGPPRRLHLYHTAGPASLGSGSVEYGNSTYQNALNHDPNSRVIFCGSIAGI